MSTKEQIPAVLRYYAKEYQVETHVWWDPDWDSIMMVDQPQMLTAEYDAMSQLFWVNSSLTLRRYKLVNIHLFEEKQIPYED